MEVAALSSVLLLVAGLCIAVVCYKVEVCARLRASETSSAQSGQEHDEGGCQGQHEVDGEVGARSKTDALPLLVIIALTSYRFHTGFLGATWVPYVIAKEGEILVPSQQAMFMGEAKLIYGLSLCFNPVFGLLSDRLAASFDMCGRSLFLIAGIGICGIGIYLAKVASDAVDVNWYLIASTIWMLGEAMADTTSEAVVPELLPPKQYDLASGVRSLQSFVGCLAGLLCLVAMRDLQHHWLYVAYSLMMVVCGLATALAMGARTRRRSARALGDHEPVGPVAWFQEAYIVPLTQSGSFARACLAMFCFSLGTAPVFFTLLLVRDLVGMPSEAEQQMHFACTSITFLIFAACSSMALAKFGSSNTEATGSSCDSQSKDACERTERRWNMMALCTGAYGVSVLGYPLVGFFGSVQSNLVALYSVSGCLGLAWGAVYSLVQTCTWSIIPSGVNVANWMGIAALAKVAGCGIGNFIAGLILYHFKGHSGSGSVCLTGYAVMSWFCAFCAFLSMVIIRDVRRQELAKLGVADTAL